MKLIMMFCLSLALCSCGFGEEHRTSKISPSGESVLSASLGNSKIKAIFRTSTIDIGSPSADEKTRRFAQCTYTRFPCILTEHLTVIIDGTDMFVPRSAYADLGDILSAEFSLQGNLFVLSITGGDASESYVVRLMFEKSRLLERRLYSGDDSKHPLETTHYYQVASE